MRKQLLGLILPLLAFVLIAAAADMPGKGPAATSALQRVEVARGPDGLLVEFTAKVEKNSGATGRLLWSESEENLAQKLITRLQRSQ